jgi:hypothetical protein
MQAPEQLEDPLTAAHDAAALWHREQAAASQHEEARAWHSDQAAHWADVADRRRRRRAGAELSRLGDDVVLEIIRLAWAEDVLALGGTSRRMRALTTLDRVWTPRLSGREFGLGRGELDTATCTALTSLGARCLFVQSLPWRLPTGSNMSMTYTWRPREVPGSLLIASQDLIFCELYERPRRGHGRWGGLARKVMPLAECGLDEFPMRPITIPWNLDTTATVYRVTWDMRIFALVDGVVVPICDTCGLSDEGGARIGDLNSRLLDHKSGLLTTTLSLRVGLAIDRNEQGHATRLKSVGILWLETIEDAFKEGHNDDDVNWGLEYGFERVSLEDGTLRPGADGFRDFLRHGTIRAQRSRSFKTDHLRDDWDHIDGRVEYSRKHT